MKYTLTLVALLSAAACVSPESHRKVVNEKNNLQALNASMADEIKNLAALNERLRTENRDLSGRAADAAWIADQKKRIDELLAKYGQGSPSAQDGVEVVQTPEGYAFRIAGGVLFSSGQNTLSDTGKRTLDELSKQLAGRKIRIEGHTDDQPITRSLWTSNLHLSAMRALEVANYLTGSAGLKAADVSLAGYSEFRPAVVGSDDAARAKNRRVEILMLER
ncbi:MAG: OmpA family protein [Planctomycetes bacterium]|nr:OmpA family protein [Planctomycetota bacterium]